MDEKSCYMCEYVIPEIMDRYTIDIIDTLDDVKPIPISRGSYKVAGTPQIVFSCTKHARLLSNYKGSISMPRRMEGCEEVNLFNYQYYRGIHRDRGYNAKEANKC